MTGLEALEEIKKQIGNIHYIDFRNDIPQQTIYELREMPLFDTIKKELKALEVIKKKNVCVMWLKTDLSSYNSTCALYGLPRLTEEEYDLLKEVIM